MKNATYEKLLDNVIESMATAGADWVKPFDKINDAKELQSVNDIFYFLCGVLRGLGIKKTWNGK